MADFSPSARQVAKIVASYPAEPAPGLHVMRPFPGPELDTLDPFLMLDDFGPTQIAAGSSGGLNPHPHRGFETVTIMLEGAMEHHDSRKTFRMPHRLRWGGMSDLGGGLDAHAKMQLNLF